MHENIAFPFFSGQRQGFPANSETNLGPRSSSNFNTPRVSTSSNGGEQTKMQTAYEIFPTSRNRRPPFGPPWKIGASSLLSWSHQLIQWAGHTLNFMKQSIETWWEEISPSCFWTSILGELIVRIPSVGLPSGWTDLWIKFRHMCGYRPQFSEVSDGFWSWFTWFSRSKRHVHMFHLWWDQQQLLWRSAVWNSPATW